jgi:cell division GTPase FtsZ
MLAKRAMKLMDLPCVLRCGGAGMGNAIMGTGQASGEDRAQKAAEDALRNPLLGEVSVKSAKVGWLVVWVVVWGGRG